MELKFKIKLRLSSRSYRSNRTFMELKLLQAKTLKNRPISSNRTFMELKYLLQISYSNT